MQIYYNVSFFNNLVIFREYTMCVLVCHLTKISNELIHPYSLFYNFIRNNIFSLCWIRYGYRD